MNNNKCDKEWKELVRKGMGQCTSKEENDDDLQIQVVDAPFKGTFKKEALAFWMTRLKNKTNNNCINIDAPPPLPSPSPPPSSALHSAKLLMSHTKSALPIVTHQREKQRNATEVINVEEVSAKMNVQKYKNSLFRTEDKNGKQPYVQSQQSKKRRYQRQIQIIQSMNMPRWMQEKERRQQLNRFKYPVSSVANSGFERNPNSRSVDTFNEATWANFQRKQELIRIKNREKQEEQKKKERQRQKELKLQKKKDDEKYYQQFASGLFGHKKLKGDDSIPFEEPPTGEVNQGEKAAQISQGAQVEKTIEAIQLQREKIKDSIQVEEGEIELIEQIEYERKKIRYGLKDIIKNNQSPYSSQIVRAVLAHNYSLDLPIVEDKKIPNIFEDEIAYKRIFHFLIANQSIAEVSQRMRQIEKDGQGDPIKVSIANVKTNTEGQTEIFMKELSPQGKPIALKGFSLSRLRIGLLTNQVEYKREYYGVSSDYETFGLVVVLVTPESKEQLGEFVKALGKVKPHDLDMVFRRNKNRQAYFYDLEKLSTSYRQYLAVTNLQYSELSSVVLNPQLMQRGMRELSSRRDCINGILEYLHSIFNQTQWESIRQMVQIERGIVLLQGPPGTGKTSTLMGLLSAQYEFLKRTGDDRKIMICAPSNAAVDHIVKRIQLQGLISGQSDIIHPQVLRVGIVETLDETVRAVSLDHLCEKQVTKESADGKLSVAQIKEKIVAIQKEMRLANKSGSQKDFNALKMEELKYNAMLYQFKEAKVVTHRKRFSYFENQFINSAQIILTTLSSSGNEKWDMLKGEIACLIIDQAAQATQPNLLIALQTGVQKVLLIGDPYQLPATCMSSDCNVTLFNRSLFQRFLDANIKPYFLNIQYRMAPLIRHFPSRRFYHNRLIDAASVVERPKPPILDCFGPRSVVFVDVKYGQEGLRGNSQLNEAEGKVVGMLVRCLMQQDISMGIITPYQAQRRIIAHQCKQELNFINSDVQLFQKNVMVNTVDSFQGQQRDIIIVSTVRANNNCNLGFLTDQRRINVTLTRSKFQLIIVGHGDTLGSNQVWNDFLEWAENEKVYYELNSPVQLKEVLKNVFQNYNSKPIKRRRYAQLSSDIRHKNREEIKVGGVKAKKAHEMIACKPNSSSQEKKSDSSKQSEEPVFKSDPDPSIVEKRSQIVSKYALDANQIQKIREQKRQKDKEAEDFQAMNNRMRIKEQEMLQSPAYSYLNF